MGSLGFLYRVMILSLFSLALIVVKVLQLRGVTGGAAARTAAITAEAKGMSAMCRRFFFEPPFMHSRLPYKSNHGPIFTHAASFGHMYLATL